MTTQKRKLTEQGKHGLLVSTTEPPPRQSANRATLQPSTQAAIATDDIDTKEGYDDSWPPKLPTSARRYQQPTHIPDGHTVQQGNKRFIYHATPIPPRQSAPGQQRQVASPQRQPHPTDIANTRANRRFHPLLWIGIILLIMVVGWIILSYVAVWFQTTLNDWQYGRPRTFQIDVVVGHNNDNSQNPSHFTAINLNRHIEIIELPAGDGRSAKIYLGPTLIGPGQDLTPVTLSFKDVNGDGHPDMVVHILGSDIVFINDPTHQQFRPALPSDHIHL